MNPEVIQGTCQGSKTLRKRFSMDSGPWFFDSIIYFI
jgi:hypothetical protein